MKSIVIIILIILLFSLFVFFLDNNLINKFSLYFNIINTISSLIVLVISLILYNKYGIDKKVKEKQIENILKLLEDLKNVRFLIEYKNNNNSVGILQIFIGNKNKSYLEEFYNLDLFFTENYIKNNEKIFSYLNNIYIPLEIKNKIKKISFSSIKGIDKFDGSIGIVDPYLNIEKKNLKNKIIGKLNGNDLSLKNFVNNWENIITEIENWIKKNNLNKEVDISFYDS